MITTMTLTETTEAAATAIEFLEALGRRDFAEVASRLAPNVWLRVLLPRKVVETYDAEDAVAELQGWFGMASDFQVLETDHHTVEGREFIRYRFLLRPDWALGQKHVIEQTGFCRVKDGRISRLDLVCTGFFPVTD